MHPTVHQPCIKRINCAQPLCQASLAPGSSQGRVHALSRTHCSCALQYLQTAYRDFLSGKDEQSVEEFFGPFYVEKERCLVGAMQGQGQGLGLLMWRRGCLARNATSPAGCDVM